MGCQIEIAIKSGATEDEISVEVVNSIVEDRATVAAPLDIDALVTACETLEDTILASAESARRVNSPGEQRLQNVGEQLFDAVFTGDVGNIYRNSVALATERSQKLRVVLRLSEPKLASLPWEAMYDSKNREYVCRNEPLVRHVEANGIPLPLEVEPPLRVLALVASPSDMPDLAIDSERARLSDALAPLVDQRRIEIEWVEQASWESVHAKLLSQTWHVVHFTGHGDYDAKRDQGTIALVGADGRGNMVDADRFADLLNQGSSRPRLVVLNSCESGRTSTRDVFSSTAATLVRRGTSAVAAMQFTVSDPSAVAFARGFYDSLVKGQTIDEAVQSGRIIILGSGSLEWVTPVLYVRGDTSRLFNVKPLDIEPAVVKPAEQPKPAKSVEEIGPDTGQGRPSIGDAVYPHGAVDAHDKELTAPDKLPRDSGDEKGAGRWTPRSLAIAGASAALVVVLAVVGTVMALRSGEKSPPPFQTYIREPGVNVRAEPSLWSKKVSYLPANATVFIMCTMIGDPVPGPAIENGQPVTTPVWDKVRTQADDRDKGYVADVFVYTETKEPQMPSCK
jgi:CHAT domain